MRNNARGERLDRAGAIRLMPYWARVSCCVSWLLINALGFKRSAQAKHGCSCSCAFVYMFMCALLVCLSVVSGSLPSRPQRAQCCESQQEVEGEESNRAEHGAEPKNRKGKCL